MHRTMGVPYGTIAAVSRIRLFAASDPASRRGHFWHFVYLHGEVEDFVEHVRWENGWPWAAPDLVAASRPAPRRPCRVTAWLYGRRVIVVLAYTQRRYPYIRGRAALATDKPALQHCLAVDEWR